VLGTEFLVTEGKNNLRVLVVEGSVSLSSAKDRIVLEAGQEGLWQIRKSTLRINANPEMNRLSWITNKLEFDNTPLSRVINQINRHFESNVRLSNRELEKCTLTGTFKDQSLNEILESISTVLDLSVHKKQNQIILKGKGC
jgi:transmembrane sensor